MSFNANGLAVGITVLILFAFATVVAIITSVSRHRQRQRDEDSQLTEEEAADSNDHRKRSWFNTSSYLEFRRKNKDLPPPPTPPKPRPITSLNSDELNTPKKLPIFKTRKSLSLSKPLPHGLELDTGTKPKKLSFSLPSPKRASSIKFTVTSPSNRSRTSTLDSMPSVESVLDQYEEEADIAAEKEKQKWKTNPVNGEESNRMDNERKDNKSEPTVLSKEYSQQRH